MISKVKPKMTEVIKPTFNIKLKNTNLQQLKFLICKNTTMMVNLLLFSKVITLIVVN